MKDFAVYLRNVRHLDQRRAGDLTERFDHWWTNRTEEQPTRWEQTISTHHLDTTRDELVAAAKTFAHQYLAVFPNLGALIYWTATACLAADFDRHTTLDADARILHDCWALEQ